MKPLTTRIPPAPSFALHYHVSLWKHLQTKGDSSRIVSPSAPWSEFDTSFIEFPQVSIPISVLLEHDFQCGAYDPRVNIGKLQKVSVTNHQCFTSYLHIKDDARSEGLSVTRAQVSVDHKFSTDHTQQSLNAMRYGVTSARRQAGRVIVCRLVSNHDRQPAQ